METAVAIKRENDLWSSHTNADISIHVYNFSLKTLVFKSFKILKTIFWGIENFSILWE